MTVENAVYTQIQLKAGLFSGTVAGTEGFGFFIDQEQRRDKEEAKQTFKLIHIQLYEVV